MPGLPKKYAKMGFKKGWKAYKATRTRFRSANKRSNPRKPSKAKSKMGKRGFLSASTVMKFARIGALVAPAAIDIINPTLNNQTKITRVVQKYTGYNLSNGQFNWGKLVEGWGPYVATSLLTHGVQKISGMIRRL